MEPLYIKFTENPSFLFNLEISKISISFADEKKNPVSFLSFKENLLNSAIEVTSSEFSSSNEMIKFLIENYSSDQFNFIKSFLPAELLESFNNLS